MVKSQRKTAPNDNWCVERGEGEEVGESSETRGRRKRKRRRKQKKEEEER